MLSGTTTRDAARIGVRRWLAERVGTWPIERRLHWALRIGVAMCFIGHGAFGIITKREWLPYFGVIGIPPEWALRLMPVVGSIDILAGVAALFSPRPIVLLYMLLWALWTALLRPLSGDTIWETLERAGNYGVPFAFLVLAGGRDALSDWLAPIRTWRLSGRLLDRVSLVLRLTTAILLAGHGALGALTSKALLAAHYATIGLPPATLHVVGWLEIIVAVAVLLRPTVALLVVVAGWKIVTELLFPIAGAPWWEFIERGGSYAAPIALAFLLHHQNSANRKGATV